LIPTASNEVLLQVRHLRVWYPTRRNVFGTPVKFIRAVEDISFDLLKGEVLGLIGETGSGKSTISRALTGMQEIESGSMVFEGHDLARLGTSGWRRMRREIQTIFQDYDSFLNPQHTIAQIISEPLLAHDIVPVSELEEETHRLLDLVHLSANVLSSYSEHITIVQQQRVAIARALAVRPKLIICDEQLTALDITAQAEILNLLRELQTALNLTYIFISRDINAVHYMADKILVMQAGKIIERGAADQIIKHPEHESTKNLIEAALSV
jgi:peptide/nickel transport system ATP-binding protein